ncbi:chromate transporter [Nocardioides marinisabuli]|uniref:Chromate transporter n=1 Tax=Nocardioides marinisabuli TaxID=419476 RepID=A0A7Y9F009_9ACTN|nr:chromate efflux transporter [Nocardioides marinisabuli]NYD57117.1 chromate transporter [Nocardioides marinisabuli]
MSRPAGDVIALRAAARVWFAISLQTFGGPAGQIAVMQRVLVEETRWIGQQRFLFALSYCTLLPGPEAQQLATYVGWLLNGVRGALVAGVLFILPGVVALLVLSGVYVTYGETTLVQALFLGLAPAVVAIVAQAVVRVARRALVHRSLLGVAVASFAALALLGVPFPAVVALAGLVGWLLSRVLPGLARPAAPAAGGGPPPLIADDALHSEPPGARRSGLVLAVGLTLWAAPVVAAALLLGRSSILVDQGLFFSGAALVTFGGAYAVLAYVAQQAVEVYGWLGPGEMVRGLALAETTPGPLVMVVQFVAFVGAYRAPGPLDPWVAAVLAALLTTWVTFVPCFLFILLGAPYVERLRGNRALAGALAGITAAVVGVIAHLGLYFALHTLVRSTGTAAWGPFSVEYPLLDTVRWPALAVALLAAVLVLRLDWPVLRVLGVCAAAGVVLGLSVGVG